MAQIYFDVQGESLFQGEPTVEISQDMELEKLVIRTDEAWHGTDKMLMLFSGGNLPMPRPVELEDGKCVIPDAILGEDSFTFSLIGQSSGRIVMATNGVRVDFVAGSVDEADPVQVSIDLLEWLWEQHENGDMGGIVGPRGPAGPAGTDGASITVVEAANVVQAQTLSAANPNTIYFVAV
ncbi:MAG: hypothetical protein FWD93_01040 [Coriobacteriia bacterium]|nr:hypothetical protein [Coriobacteriia bacterium]